MDCVILKLDPAARIWLVSMLEMVLVVVLVSIPASLAEANFQSKMSAARVCLVILRQDFVALPRGGASVSKLH